MKKITFKEARINLFNYPFIWFDLKGKRYLLQGFKKTNKRGLTTNKLLLLDTENDKEVEYNYNKNEILDFYTIEY